MIALAPVMPKLIKTKRALAEQLGRPYTTVLTWLQRDDFPFKRDPPWRTDTVAKIARWVSETIDPDGTGAYATMRDNSTTQPQSSDDEADLDPRESLRREVARLDPLKLARFHKLKRETEKLGHQIGILQERYVDRDAARAEIRAVIHNTKTALLAEARASAASLDSMGLLTSGAKRRVERLLLERIEAICNRFADGMHAALGDDET
ncbi:MAG: hypothetical protein SYC29_04385 [Planctomycetota bacterium]|nr:hypothetical protein [Planctomycetota bacterium]